jgi:hypothetical protein
MEPRFSVPRRPLAFWVYKLLSALSAVIVTSCAANAEGLVPRINTPHGLLLTRDGHGKECGEYLDRCQIVALNGRILFADFAAYVSAVYPSQSNPSLVSITTATGGNACCRENYILDFTSPSVSIIKGFGFDKNIFQAEGGVIFSQYGEDDDLGDKTVTLYKYNFGLGTPKLLRRFPEYSTTPLSQKKFPWDVLSDPEIRRPLLLAVGAAYFSKYRINLGVSSADQLRIVDDRYIVGSGCMPHSCNTMGGFFVIDQRRQVAWGLERVNEWGPLDSTSPGPGTAKLWGVLKKRDAVPVKLIGAWIKENNVAWNSISVMPLAPEVRRDYDLPATDNSSHELQTNGDTSGTVPINNLAPNTIELSPVTLFKTLSPSVYIVHAKRTNGDELQGSAVVVSDTTLLTNCHVVGGAAELSLVQNDQTFEVRVISANVRADRCILETVSRLKTYVPIRPFDQLEVGEKVYSIGAPLGLELTLSDGLLSGKREVSGSHSAQTTAPISPGSSGGGLFDAYGNLIGITTFLLKDSENLNFAIAAQEYVNR